jgi:hypothetical protein
MRSLLEMMCKWCKVRVRGEGIVILVRNFEFVIGEGMTTQLEDLGVSRNLP